ncbi:MAG TPA: hypothetical protein VMJ11_21060, partial [Paraburkholderia sp.]|uniref:hypothetical protein n=1 Tax=Paraburkholderia sp. TaxID=1926495 RepID=UPI002C14E292
MSNTLHNWKFVGSNVYMGTSNNPRFSVNSLRDTMIATESGCMCAAIRSFPAVSPAFLLHIASS